MMICGNLPTVLSIEYYPFWLVLCNAWAAPLFIVISGMMVVFTTQTKGHRLKYFLARGTLLIIVGLLIEVFMLGGYPFMFFQILYLIGVSLPIAYLFAHLNTLSRWITVIIFFLSHPLLQEILKHANHIIHRFIVDGWFPIFPWLGFSLLGVNLAYLRWKPNSHTGMWKNFAFSGIGILAFGGFIWRLTFHYYGWPSVGYVISAIGVILVLFPIVDYKPSLILYKPLQALGESSLFMYVLHLSLIYYIVAPTWSKVNLETFLLIYIAISSFMVLVAYGLRVLKGVWKNRPFIVRFFLGS
ncbi:DUF1624 domain-containing protein [Candidatus Bathyarchaeota archaeon A05DMB-3]|jgi:uncharacterized membrane protein|nr:DUF1624 domain-containing protein [Candidatus Bathyarchaeota archaeon A05DMB-3]